jgi:hypothetical protein
LRQWSLLLIAGLLIVVLLSQLPSVERELQQRRQSVSVFQPDKAKWLTDENLVDAISKIQLRERLAKVGWDHAILTIDLFGSKPDSLLADMRRLIVFAYSDYTNVKQVLIRVFKDGEENRRLLLAAETRKSDWTEKQLSAEAPSAMIFQGTDPSSRIRVTLTPSGRRWFANFSIS